MSQSSAVCVLRETCQMSAGDGVFFQRKDTGERRISTAGGSFGDVFSDWQPGKESFLFFAPHDDDPAISVGLIIRQAKHEGIPVRIVVVTDGRNGYVTLRDRATIVERRVEETLASYAILGVPESEISFLNFPDGGLQNYMGRRVGEAGDPRDEQGYTGLENHFVRELRRRTIVNGQAVAPTRVFVPSAADYHQDHVAVAQEVPISLFHALGGVWPECGEKIERAPFLYWHCVYCKLPDNRTPNIRITGSKAAFQDKMRSVEAYNSQGQIASVMEELRKAPPVEYLLEESFSLYKPGVYDKYFE
jgi:LmbE family N-acetylglucosaminyl deacetylase